jgi:hypothetical protein
MVVVQHILNGVIYGDTEAMEPAVLRQSERRRGVDRRVASPASV